jgi:hypothetical protein
MSMICRPLSGGFHNIRHTALNYGSSLNRVGTFGVAGREHPRERTRKSVGTRPEGNVRMRAYTDLGVLRFPWVAGLESQQ